MRQGRARTRLAGRGRDGEHTRIHTTMRTASAHRFEKAHGPHGRTSAGRASAPAARVLRALFALSACRRRLEPYHFESEIALRRRALQMTHSCLRPLVTS
eukprot:5243112-Prymnesium_polylepis.1